jgi:hypothetical protein
VQISAHGEIRLPAQRDVRESSRDGGSVTCASRGARDGGSVTCALRGARRPDGGGRKLRCEACDGACDGRATPACHVQIRNGALVQMWDVGAAQIAASGVGGPGLWQG